MSLYKRGTIWWIRFTAPTGQEVRESAQTADKRHAQEYHDRRKAELWRIAKLGEKPRHTWREAVVRWVDEHQDQKSLKSTLCHLRELDPDLGGLYLDQITRDRIETFIARRQTEAVTPATINRALATIRSLLNTASREWGWLDQLPIIRLLKEPKQRIRWLTHEEADRLAHELPTHLRAMMRFTLATGLRESNVCQLQWCDIDLERHCAWIHADQAKGGKALSIPLNAEAMAILLEQPPHPTQVFTFEGQPIQRANNHAWRKALRRAGIENFRWHDLRHTWASWHVMAGTPLEVLKALGGWASLEMVLRYAHLSSAHLAQHAERITRTESVTPQKLKLVNSR